MKRTLHDLGKLNKAIIAPSEPPPEPPPEKPSASSDDAYVLAYFSHGGNSTPTHAVPRRKSRPAAPAPAAVSPATTPIGPTAAETNAKIETRIRDLESRASAAESRAAAAEAKLALAAGEQLRLQAECARLAAELSEAQSPQTSAETPAAPSSSDAPAPVQPAAGKRPPLLSEPTFSEAFPGELRELLLAALADAQDDASRNGRERRAAALSAVLAANAPSGELERRRAALRQILKDAGAFNDNRAIAKLEKLGFRLISGKKHWKLEYAGIRFPLAKTPSDFRAHLNTATDVANRCL